MAKKKASGRAASTARASRKTAKGVAAKKAPVKKKASSGGKTEGTLSWKQYKENTKVDWGVTTRRAKSMAGQTSLVEGTYPAKLIDAKLRNSFRTKGVLALEMTFAVTDGEYEGEVVSTVDDIDPTRTLSANTDATPYDILIQHIGQLGYEVSEDPDFDEVIGMLKADQPEAEIDIVIGDTGRAYVRRIRGVEEEEE